MSNIKEMLRKLDSCNAEIATLRPFQMPMLKPVRDFYRVSTTWSSNALEGNSLTIEETKILLEDGIAVGGKPFKDLLEAYGHGRAYDFMCTLVEKTEINLEDIRSLHKLFYQAIDSGAAGVYRSIPVCVSGSEMILPSAKDVSAKMEELGKWMKEDGAKLHPVVYAADLHRRFVEVHPFEDGNGRTARLLMNTVLIQNGYLPCVISPYIRFDYIQTLEGAHKGLPEKFIQFIAEAEYETEKDFIRAMELEMPKSLN